MLSAVYAHTANNVLSSTMAWKILYQGSRFKFSHDTVFIQLQHLIDWAEGAENLEFKLRKVKQKNDSSEYDHVVDMFINNIIYRPLELENISCFELISKYEMKTISSKKETDEEQNINVESKKVFNLAQEHPSYEYMVMSERTKIVIPQITNTKLLPNVNELSLELKTTDDTEVLLKREKYGQIVLLLFFPYCIEDDLMIEGSYWKKYVNALDNNLISKKCLEVMQNIQDVTYNCCDLKLASDVLESTTEYTPHVDDDKKTNKKKEDVISSSEFEDVIRSLIINSNHGIR